ncbi:MAG TPA: T9SS type A sorting domain-containing protein [Bacteroidia bacterium]|nr:T9SS type A sorting domain-containing protein [Bacteroidia bacterium]
MSCPLYFFGQGKAYNWLIGYQSATDANTTSRRMLAHTDSINSVFTPTSFKMPFSSCQATISDENGNLIISSNGCWVANAIMDTMKNGGGLNPGPFSTIRCTNISANPFPHANTILPMPDSSNKYYLFHMTGNNNMNSYLPTEIYYSVIDISKDGGLGAVDSTQKNVIMINDTLSMGIAACKHANGRDWWIVVAKDSSDLIYKILLSPNGITSITSQHLNVPIVKFNAGQPTFSQDGSKFAYTFGYGTSTGGYYHDVRLFDFDRCNGVFSNPHVINITDSIAGLGMAFSSNSTFLYACSFERIFQINTSTLSVDTVAIYDGHFSPSPPFYSYFWSLYLAPNGKIYCSTANGTLELHLINYPDSSGLSCDVQQHVIPLTCYAFRANVNHPNYYLGCDTTSSCPCLTTSLNEIEKNNFNFSLSPNPSNGNIKLMYILPQNKSGTFQIFDINGKAVYSQNLPQWSTLQNIDVSFLSPGVYSCQINSNNFLVSKKVVIIK